MVTSFQLHDDAKYFEFLNKENVNPSVWSLLTALRNYLIRTNKEWAEERDIYNYVESSVRREAIAHNMIVVEAQPRPLDDYPDSPQLLTRVYKLTLKGWWFSYINATYGPK